MRQLAYGGRGLHGLAVEMLGRRIVGGRVAPGAALPTEQELADEFGVSRSVVREAMKVLAAKGLVSARPMAGTHVRARSEWHLIDPDVLAWRAETDGAPTLLRDLLEVRGSSSRPRQGWPPSALGGCRDRISTGGWTRSRPP
jgi:DNA-binding FadR family transcriptional regulator